MAKADKNDPTVAAFLDTLGSNAQRLTDQQIAIRQAFYTKQDTAVRALASQATDPSLRAALQTYADGWAELSAPQGSDAPATTQPDWQPVMNLCPGIQKRIFADLEARGQ